jgi:hypothetical protein
MSDWVELLFTYDVVEAEIVKDLLEAEDVQVVVKSSKISPYPVSIGGMGEIRILVKSEDLEKARDVLSVMKQDQEKKEK